MLPFLFHAFHELLEAWLAADVGEPRVFLSEKRVINTPTVQRSVLQPIQGVVRLVKV
jgi:hypothetical protein